MIRAYIAAPWPLKLYAEAVSQNLNRDLSINAECQWFKHKDGDNPQECITHDLDDIENADIFILINSKEWANIGTGGRHFETGYAFLAGKRIYILGEWTNLFHRHRSITICKDYNELVASLKARQKYGLIV